MPDTFRSYEIREVALAGLDRRQDGFEHAQAGDIIAIRKPLKGIGFLEMSTFLWLHIEGPDVSFMDRYTDPGHEPLDEEEGPSIEPSIDTTLFDKRRFCIPLARLKTLVPSLDLSRVADPADIYQPFLLVDEDTGEFLTTSRPFSVHGLVFDKAKGVFV